MFKIAFKLAACIVGAHNHMHHMHHMHHMDHMDHIGDAFIVYCLSNESDQAFGSITRLCCDVMRLSMNSILIGISASIVK